MTDQNGFLQIKLDFDLSFWQTICFALSFPLDYKLPFYHLDIARLSKVACKHTYWFVADG